MINTTTLILILNNQKEMLSKAIANNYPSSIIEIYKDSITELENQIKVKS